MITTKRNLRAELTEKKYSFISGNEFTIAPELQVDFENFQQDWEDMPPDNYLKDKAIYRFRRLHYFYVHPTKGEVLPLPSRAFFQPEEDNSYTGGMHRKYEPFLERTFRNRFLHELIKFSFWQSPAAADQALINQPWEVDVHLVRIISFAGQTGEPTPEGIHRDGGDCGFVYLMNRKNVTGAVSTVYDNDRNPLERHTLMNPMDAMFFWDPHVLHSVSSMHPENPEKIAVRDALLFGFFPKPALERPVEMMEKDRLINAK